MDPELKRAITSILHWIRKHWFVSLITFGWLYHRLSQIFSALK